jgi:hypothetical protein
MIPDALHSFVDDSSNIKILQVPLEGKLGALNRATGDILIEPNQPEAGKHVILFHELFHYAAELMIQHGIIRRQPDEKFIESAAPIVLTFLVASGLYTGISKEEFKAFAEAQALR